MFFGRNLGNLQKNNFLHPAPLYLQYLLLHVQLCLFLLLHQVTEHTNNGLQDEVENIHLDLKHHYASINQTKISNRASEHFWSKLQINTPDFTDSSSMASTGVCSGVVLFAISVFWESWCEQEAFWLLLTKCQIFMQTFTEILATWL